MITGRHLFFFLLQTFFFITKVFTLENSLARTPPMGWLAWERFKCQVDCKKHKDNCINEKLFMQMADRLVEDGYRDAGYTQINIDDCWMSNTRSWNGELVPDPTRFPHGIKFLADYMHKRGLKLGIYQDFGKHTCMGFPGIIGHMEQDAQTFAKWEVDMVKLDGCHSQPEDMDEGYTLIGKYLNKTGRPMIYSCSWPYYQLIHKVEPNYELISKTCNMWRVYHDIFDNWGNVIYIMDFFGDNQEVLTKFVGPGRWTDPDMLVIGNFHLTYAQSRIHMSLWAMLPAPLLMSNDLRKIDPKLKQLLLNKGIIAVDQDILGLPGKRIYKKDDIEVWKRPISPVLGGETSFALLFISRRGGYEHFDVTFRLKQFGLNNTWGYHLIDLYDQGDYGAISIKKEITFGIGGMDSVMLRADVLDKTQYKKLKKGKQ